MGECEVGQMNADLDEMSSEARMSEERAQRAMVDAARLAEELRLEQDTASNLERERKVVETMVKDAHTRCDETEMNALKGGKKAVNKMESRIRELESELEAESRRLGDAQKNQRKSERKIKEIAALNLAKFRQTQGCLGSAEERAAEGEQALARSRLRARSASIGPM